MPRQIVPLATAALLAATLLAGCTTNSGIEATSTFQAARLLPTMPPRATPARLPYSDTSPPRTSLNGGEWVIGNVSPTALYRLPVRMNRVTLLLAPEGENVNKPFGGDVDGFAIEGGYADNLAAVAIAPMLPGRQTNLILTTTGGIYNFLLHSAENGGWLSRVDVRRAAPLKPISFPLAPSGQYERLLVSAPAGEPPAWSPLEVWADATKLVVRFAEPLPPLPGLYAGQAGEQVVGYRVQRSPGYVTLVTDRRVTEAELRLDRETLRITAPPPGQVAADGWRQAGPLPPWPAPAAPVTATTASGTMRGGPPPGWVGVPVGHRAPAPAMPPRLQATEPVPRRAGPPPTI